MSDTVVLTVNGRQEEVDAPPTTALLHVLRNVLKLKGTRFGCGLEQCGSCMVLVDGVPVYSCTREIGTIGNCHVTTIEGLAEGPNLHPVQTAFLDHQAGQCGYCLNGIIMSATALLREQPNPSRAQIVAALDKHLCRCGAHQRIINAVQAAAQSAEAHA